QSIEIPSQFHQKQVIALRSAGISDFICHVGSSFGSEFDRCAGSEISSAVVSRKPIGGQSQMFTDRLLDAELASRFIPRSDYVGGKIECSKGQTGLGVERFRELSVGIIACIVGPVLCGDEDIVSQHEGPAVFAAIVSFPFDSWRRSGL